MGYQTSVNLKEVISIVSFKQNINLRIQILAGNTLISIFHVGFEIELPLVSYNCVMHFYSKQDWSCKKYLSRYELTYPKMDKICQIQYILPRIFWISTISPFCSTDFTLKETLKNTQPFVKFSPISLSSLLWQFLDFPSKWNRCIKRGKRVGIQNLLTILRNEFARGIKVCIA